jgi:hypothetical protein
MILMTLFRARQTSQSEASASKITPIIVIEEPESFLHPSAQAEFGRILQDLSAEFQVQVIVTTHSPYMLSKEKPTSNLLLERSTSYGQLRETRLVDTCFPRCIAVHGRRGALRTFGATDGIYGSATGPAMSSSADYAVARCSRCSWSLRLPASCTNA